MSKSVQEILMFGCTEAELGEMIRKSKFMAKEMLAASILSDAQEILASGQTERARQYINRAKFALFADAEGKVL